MSNILKHKANKQTVPYQSTLSYGPPDGLHCEICGQLEEVVGSGKKVRSVKALSHDHCHASDTYRGMLCHRCNIALGLMRDNTDILRNAIRYLWHYGHAKFLND